MAWNEFGLFTAQTSPSAEPFPYPRYKETLTNKNCTNLSDCNDGNSCTSDTCSYATGKCVHRTWAYYATNYSTDQSELRQCAFKLGGCGDGVRQQVTECGGTYYGHPWSCADSYSGGKYYDGGGHEIVINEEACDDGNNTDGDGCSFECLVEHRCGDGVIDNVYSTYPYVWRPGQGVGDEICDDGNNNNGDGCSEFCYPESSSSSRSSSSSSSSSKGECEDDRDNDGDGLKDGQDPGCMYWGAQDGNNVNYDKTKTDEDQDDPWDDGTLPRTLDEAKIYKASSTDIDTSPLAEGWLWNRFWGFLLAQANAGGQRLTCINAGGLVFETYMIFMLNNAATYPFTGPSCFFKAANASVNIDTSKKNEYDARTIHAQACYSACYKAASDWIKGPGSLFFNSTFSLKAHRIQLEWCQADCVCNSSGEDATQQIAEVEAKYNEHLNIMSVNFQKELAFNVNLPAMQAWIRQKNDEAVQTRKDQRDQDKAALQQATAGAAGQCFQQCMVGASDDMKRRCSPGNPECCRAECVTNGCPFVRTPTRSPITPPSPPPSSAPPGGNGGGGGTVAGNNGGTTGGTTGGGVSSAGTASSSGPGTTGGTTGGNTGGTTGGGLSSAGKSAGSAASVSLPDKNLTVASCTVKQFKVWDETGLKTYEYKSGDPQYPSEFPIYIPVSGQTMPVSGAQMQLLGAAKNALWLMWQRIEYTSEYHPQSLAVPRPPSPNEGYVTQQEGVYVESWIAPHVQPKFKGAAVLDSSDSRRGVTAVGQGVKIEDHGAYGLYRHAGIGTFPLAGSAAVLMPGVRPLPSGNYGAYLANRPAAASWAIGTNGSLWTLRTSDKTSLLSSCGKPIQGVSYKPEDLKKLTGFEQVLVYTAPDGKEKIIQLPVSYRHSRCTLFVQGEFGRAAADGSLYTTNLLKITTAGVLTELKPDALFGKPGLTLFNAYPGRGDTVLWAILSTPTADPLVRDFFLGRIAADGKTTLTPIVSADFDPVNNAYSPNIGRSSGAVAADAVWMFYYDINASRNNMLRGFLRIASDGSTKKFPLADTKSPDASVSALSVDAGGTLWYVLSYPPVDNEDGAKDVPALLVRQKPDGTVSKHPVNVSHNLESLMLGADGKMWALDRVWRLGTGNIVQLSCSDAASSSSVSSRSSSKSSSSVSSVFTCPADGCAMNDSAGVTFCKNQGLVCTSTKDLPCVKCIAVSSSSSSKSSKAPDPLCKQNGCTALGGNTACESIEATCRTSDYLPCFICEFNSSKNSSRSSSSRSSAYSTYSAYSNYSTFSAYSTYSAFSAYSAYSTYSNYSLPPSFSASSAHIVSLIVCGNGITDPGEQCDDGNLSDTDVCTTQCRVNANPLPASSSRPALVRPASAPARSSSAYVAIGAPRPGFNPMFCGNAILDVAEDCDLGLQNSDLPNASCRTDCTLTRCGDQIVDTIRNEQCDDGNGTDGDGCSVSCTIEQFAGNPSSAPVLPGSLIELPFVPGTPNQPSVVTRPLPVPTHGPVGDTGPETVAIMAAGASAGYTWMKMRKMKK